MNKSLGFGSEDDSGFRGINNADVGVGACVLECVGGTDDGITSELVLVMMESE
jgi:hypothetical protein